MVKKFIIGLEEFAVLTTDDGTLIQNQLQRMLNIINKQTDRIIDLEKVAVNKGVKSDDK